MEAPNTKQNDRTYGVNLSDKGYSTWRYGGILNMAVWSVVMLPSLWLLICILAVEKQTFVTEILLLNSNLDLTSYYIQLVMDYNEKQNFQGKFD